MAAAPVVSVVIPDPPAAAPSPPTAPKRKASAKNGPSTESTSVDSLPVTYAQDEFYDGAGPQKNSRRYVYTIWLDKIPDIGLTSDLVTFFDSVKPLIQYAVWQREITPTTQKKHLQCFIRLHHKYSTKGTTLMGRIGLPRGSYHFAYARGTDIQNQAYCTKDATRDPAPGSGPFHIGEPCEGQGTNTEAKGGNKRLVDMIKAGVSHQEMAQTETDAYLRNAAKIPQTQNALKGLMDPPPVFRERPIVGIFWGPGGVGKSYKARTYAIEWLKKNNLPETNIYPLPVPEPNEKCRWTGYAGEEVVLIEEFEGQIDMTLLKRWMDQYGCYVEPKNTAHVALRARVFLFTSNKNPKSWFGLKDASSFFRRVTFTKTFKACDQHPDTYKSTIILDQHKGLPHYILEDEERANEVEILKKRLVYLQRRVTEVTKQLEHVQHDDDEGNLLENDDEELIESPPERAAANSPGLSNVIAGLNLNTDIFPTLPILPTEDDWASLETPTAVEIAASQSTLLLSPQTPAAGNSLLLPNFGDE